MLPETYDLKKGSIYPVSPLRPEFVESAYYLFKATGDSKYQEMGLHFFRNMKEQARNSVAYASLEHAGGKVKLDSLESFFFAETMKYLYLLFSNSTFIDTETMVFNTEAHPVCKVNGCFKQPARSE